MEPESFHVPHTTCLYMRVCHLIGVLVLLQREDLQVGFHSIIGIAFLGLHLS